MNKQKFDKRNSLDQLLAFFDKKGYRIDTASGSIYKLEDNRYYFERYYSDKQDLVNFANSL